MDNIIDAAQTQLRQAFPVLSGLQSVICGLTMNLTLSLQSLSRSYTMAKDTGKQLAPPMLMYMCMTACIHQQAHS